MDKLVIIGKNSLSGTVNISGAKNAVLPAMAATLIAPGIYRIHKVPDLRDTRTMIKLLEIIGAKVVYENGILEVDTRECDNPEAPYELVKTMRASFYVLCPLLARFGYAKVSLPGGCAWGPRPVNYHISGIEKMGAKTELDQGYIIAKADRLKGETITFDTSSVGATGNLVMASVLAEGKTIIQNAAREPEIMFLCRFLNEMGADISGIGTDCLIIHGVDDLQPVEIEVIPDRIETATFLIAGALIGEGVTVAGVESKYLTVVLDKLQEAGCELNIEDKSITIFRKEPLKPVNIVTAVYPGFPTDVQAQWMALMTLAEGSSVITDTIYHDRFTHVAELTRLGARIKLQDNVATVTGVKELRGATVMSTDIRASASLILAALATEGRTDISRVYHIDRGYEKIEEKFRGIGATIWREEE